MVGLLSQSYFSYIQPRLLGKSVDMLTSNQSYEFYRLVIIIAGLYATRYVLSLIVKYGFINISQLVNEKLRVELLSKAIDMEMDYFDQNKKGYIQSRINEAGLVSTILSPNSLTVLTGCLEFFIAAVSMSLLDIKMSLFAFAILPVYYLLIKKHTKKLSKYSNLSMEKGAILSADVFSVVNDIEQIKVIGDKKRRINKFAKKFNTLKEILILQGKSIISYFENTSLLNSFTTVAVLAISGYKIFSGEFTLGNYATYASYTGRFFASVVSIASIGITFTPLLVSVDRIKEFLNTKDESCDRNLVLRNMIYRIQIKGLTFFYQRNPGENVIENINLDWKLGDKVWLQGVNGSGKTTLIKILLGLYPIKTGQVLINGMPLNKIERGSLRKAYSVMLQNSTVFYGTLLDNILCVENNRDKESKLDEIISNYNLMDYFPNLEGGLHCHLSDKSTSISGGQSQLILFLRTILNENRVLIFDEPTSNMDQTLKPVIMRILNDYCSNKLIILISHDLTIKKQIIDIGFKKENILDENRKIKRIVQ